MKIYNTYSLHFWVPEHVFLEKNVYNVELTQNVFNTE